MTLKKVETPYYGISTILLILLILSEKQPDLVS